MRLDMIINVASITVTLISILTTSISIWQSYKNRKNQNYNFQDIYMEKYKGEKQMKKSRIKNLYIVVIMLLILTGCGGQTEENVSNQTENVLVNNLSITDKIEIDPFEYVTIEYDGDSYLGEVKKINNNATDDFLSGLTFDIDKDYGLANGDTITVSIRYLSTVNEQALEHNYILTQTEKEYTVEGLPYYIYSLSEIPDNLMEEMRNTADEELENFLTNDMSIIYNKEIIDIESEYIGNMLWSFKNISAAYANHCYFVYKIHVKTEIDEFDYYFYIEFYDLYKDKDGEVTLRTESVGMTQRSDEESFIHNEELYMGFESIEDMINQYEEDKWTFDSNIAE